MGSVRAGGVHDNFKFFGLCNWKSGVDLKWGSLLEEKFWDGDIRSAFWDLFKVSVRYRIGSNQ